MDKKFRDLPIFVEVARKQSITKASEALGMPISTVSRRILNLEKTLGFPLFLHSTRKIQLTEQGREFYERCSLIVRQTEEAWEDLTTSMKKPKGNIRICIPEEVLRDFLMGCLSSFGAKWPDICMHVYVAQSGASLTPEPFDLEFCYDPLPDLDMRAKKIMRLNTGLYAIPSLFEKYPIPKTPEHLAMLPCITRVHRGSVWRMGNGKVSRNIAIKPAHYVNSPTLSLDFALRGLGVTWLASVQVRQYLKAGELVHILPEWTMPGYNMYLLMGKGTLPHRVSLLAEHIQKHFASLDDD